MEINQLRIGNCVKFMLNDEDYEIIYIDVKDLELIEKKQGIYEPIPITEEWLLKFGFEKSNKYCFSNHKLIIESLMGDRHSCRYRVNPDESIWISELHYVHQLQNLYFSLVGEELTFKSE